MTHNSLVIGQVKSLENHNRLTNTQWFGRALASATLLAWAPSVCAASYFFSTANPDGKMATASRPGPGPGEPNQETESGDDFISFVATRAEILCEIKAITEAGIDFCSRNAGRMQTLQEASG